MTELVKKYGFALVYTQDLKDSSKRTHWNAGLTLNNVDDLGFLSEQAPYLQETSELNTSQTFTSGYSNGGFMSYEIVNRPEIFRAAASISRTESLKPWNNRTFTQAVPIYSFLEGSIEWFHPLG